MTDIPNLNIDEASVCQRCRRPIGDPTASGDEVPDDGMCHRNTILRWRTAGDVDCNAETKRYIQRKVGGTP